MIKCQKIMEFVGDSDMELQLNTTHQLGKLYLKLNQPEEARKVLMDSSWLYGLSISKNSNKFVMNEAI